MDVPAALVIVHLQNQAAFAGRTVNWRIKEQKTRAYLGNGNGITIPVGG